MRAEYLSSMSNYPRGLQHLAPPDFMWLRVFEVYPPFAARLIIHFPNGGRLWILNAASPIAARKTRLFCPLARNFDKDSPIDEVHKFNLLIFNEDRVIVELQRPEDLPLDLQMEAHIAADRTSIAYRRRGFWRVQWHILAGWRRRHLRSAHLRRGVRRSRRLQPAIRQPRPRPGSLGILERPQGHVGRSLLSRTGGRPDLQNEARLVRHPDAALGLRDR